MRRHAPSPLEGRVRDGRSGRVVFVSHCLLNENVRYLGGATRPGAVQEVIDRCTRDGLGLYQMPCPEQRAWGGVRKARMTRLYGSRLLRSPTLCRVFAGAARVWTLAVSRRLARRVAADVADYVRSGGEVVAIVGVGASPSCGVSSTLDLERALAAMARCDLARLDRITVNETVVAANVVAGSGLFTSCLTRQLRRRGLEVPFEEHDLLEELRSQREGTEVHLRGGGGPFDELHRRAPT